MPHFFFAALLFPACDGLPIGWVDDTAPDIDTESDTESDTGADTGTDTDPGPRFTLTLLEDDVTVVEFGVLERVTSGSATLTGSTGAWTALAGMATVYSTNISDGSKVCDFDVDLVGVAASTLCPNCDFDFEMDATITRDASSIACDYETELSWLDTADKYATSMQYLNAYTTPVYTESYFDRETGEWVTYSWGGYDVPARLQSSYWNAPYTYYYGGVPYTYGPYENSFTIARVGDTGGGGWDDDDVDEDAPAPPPIRLDTGVIIDTGGGWETGGGGWGSEGSVTRDGAALEWENSSTEYWELLSYLDTTCGYEWSSERAALPGTVTETEDLACDDEIADVWTLDLRVGDTFSVSVDTVAARTAFTPVIWVNSPDTCTEIVAEQNYRCSFGHRLSCPSLEWTAHQAGDWQIVVANTDCRGVGEYNIEVDVY